jgi:hypothetical protein
MAPLWTLLTHSPTLIAFRASLYSRLGKRSDALFELTDAMLTAGPQPSPVHLSLEAAHHRGWGSLYGALSHGTIDTSALRALLARYPLGDEPVRVYGVDSSAWARCDAESSPGRGYYYHPTRGTRRPRPVVRGTLVLVEVAKLPQRTREPRRLWLWWQGSGEPDLDLLWRAYTRRFDLEHTFRFLKQVLGWSTPRVRHPQQADRWTWLVAAAYMQLRLARGVVADRRLPWERRLDTGQLTPCRVRRAFSVLLLALGTPANPPKPCGRSPGRPTSSRSGRAPRHPALKKAA